MQQENVFSRLEAREILRNLDTGDCDDEVVAKLVAIAQHKTIASDPHAPTWTVKTIVNGSEMATASSDDISMPRGAYGHLNDEEFASLRLLRATESKRAIDQSKLLAFESMAPLQLPPGYAVENVAKGNRNSAGDVCVEINPDGFSIFVCPQGHGYISNNPAVHGCTLCAISGNTSSNREETQGVKRTDPGAIDGEDSRW